MIENARNVNAVRARYAILAVIAWYHRILHHYLCYILKEIHILHCQRLEWGEVAQIVLKMLHVCHAAKYAEHPRLGSAETESLSHFEAASISADYRPLL